MCLYVRVAVFGLGCLSTYQLPYVITIFIIFIVLIVSYVDQRVCRHCAASSSSSSSRRGNYLRILLHPFHRSVFVIIIFYKV